MAGDADQPKVFISYAHKDEAYKDEMMPHFQALENAGRVTVWDDRKIGAGEKWYEEIEQALEGAALAVCLVSPNFLASEFCTGEEIPYLLDRRDKAGLIIIPVLLYDCTWEAFSWLRETQMLPRDGKSIYEDFKDDRNRAFLAVARRILEIVDDPDYRPTPPPEPRWDVPERVDLERLPQTGYELFGRQDELLLMDQAWETEDTTVISLVAWGGVGKSTLVNKWLESMEADNFRGARQVFGWSFYSQGTGGVASADQFVAKALQWFGDDDPTAGSPWDKGVRLAAHVRRERTLLVLDGMEPLQSGHDFDHGRINDPALATLIAELARDNSGLCVISTRAPVAEPNALPASVVEKDLEQISDEAGRVLLHVRRIQGSDAELEAATREFGNHALAVNLLAAFIHDIPGRHISNAADIANLDIPDEDGRHPRRVIAAFVERFGDGPEVELLSVLGLFDRPADGASVAAVRAQPTIPGLTEHLAVLSEADWPGLLTRLRDARLIATESGHAPGALDAHPLVREHFAARLREGDAESWRKGNNRLYEHLTATADEFPDTLEAMAPLYAAVMHGCAAGRHQDALNDVYKRRIQRGNEFYSSKKLGALGAELERFPIIPVHSLS